MSSLLTIVTQHTNNNNNNNSLSKMKQLRDSLIKHDELDYYHQNPDVEQDDSLNIPAGGHQGGGGVVIDLPEFVAKKFELQENNNNIKNFGKKFLPGNIIQEYNNNNINMKGPQIDPNSIPTVLRRNTSFDSCVLQKNERRVLVIYTGGTIGMVRSAKGALVPLPNMLEKTVRTFPHLHDEKYAKMRFGDMNEQPVVLPEMNEDKTRIIYTIYEYDPLLDSSNMTMDDWIRIAQDVKDNYEKFDAFVILHGTDTMAYTAPALSFMMDSLGKSVVITGSQIPLFETRSDGRDNFLGALILAASYVIPEVTVYFGHRLFRGNRISKVSADSLNAFDSPNLQPLATMGINIQVNYHNIFRPREISPFTIRTSLNRNVGLLRLFPSITLETVRVFLQAPTLGVVLQTYGAGNFPTNRTDLLKEFEDASKRGVLIVNCTQCGHGTVSAIYETGQMTQNIGILPGYDMTPEAALTKLSYVLGRSDWDLEKKREMLTTNLKGELTKVGGKLHQSQNFSSPPPAYGDLTHGFNNSNGSSNLDRPAEFVIDCSRLDGPNSTNMGNTVPVGPDILQNVVRVLSSSLGYSSPEEQLGLKRLIAPSLSCALVSQNNNCGVVPTQVIMTSTAGPSDSPVKLLENLFGSSESEICSGDYLGRTSLHCAAAIGDLSIVKFLLTKGASVHIRDNRGYSPLREAIEFDQHEVIEMLRKCGAHLSLEPTVLGAELNLATIRGDITRLKSFWLAGANLNQADPCSRSPLHIATESGNVQLVEWLLRTGRVNSRVKNRFGQTPLNLAVVLGHQEIAQLLAQFM